MSLQPTASGRALESQGHLSRCVQPSSPRTLPPAGLVSMVTSVVYVVGMHPVSGSETPAGGSLSIGSYPFDR